ncbi:cation diffusion facilitator CzcD-associated flavoprotein CzcO [Streptomyces glaucescens]
MTRTAPVVVIGGGRSGLAAGYRLRRLGVDFVILDAETTLGGAWQHASDLADHEKRYELPVERPVRVLGIHRDGRLLRV